MTDLKKVKDRINYDLARREILTDELNKKTTSLSKIEERHNNAIKARTILQLVSSQVQINIVERFNRLVSMALSSVFPVDPYRFEMEFVTRRNKQECDIYFTRNGERIDPMGDSGGGVLDIASFACRVVFYSLKRTTPFMALDEPMKHLSSSFQPAASEMIKTLNEKLGIQFLIVTHLDNLKIAADKIFSMDN